MFTGLIETTAKITVLKNNGLELQTELGSQVKKGDSLAVNGVCLTVANNNNNRLAFDFLPETYKSTSFQYLKVGNIVNLERAMAADGRFDGHIVSGHVDGLAKVLDITQRSDTYLLKLQAPDELVKYIAVKGSVALNGISLTVQNVNRDDFEVAIIPFTYEHTSLKTISRNDQLNLEVDLIARYLESLVAGQDKGLSYQKLMEKGCD